LIRKVGTLKKITISEIDQEGGDPEENHQLHVVEQAGRDPKEDLHLQIVEHAGEDSEEDFSIFKLMSRVVETLNIITSSSG
jgi:hypothetical protein